ncbi:class II histone deacetylase [Brevibacterium pigmentatum]|uniref:class II histone deacetylase n=1 Tax=Brevibacterium pigmentatum TaxID=1496080 RepID=UPI0014208459|nr:class II histone deacetylase [Brevibacterium pigmentatum]
MATTTPAVRKTGYIWHEIFAWHDTGTRAGFPYPTEYAQPYRTFENSESKSRLAGLVEVSGLLDQLVRIKAEPASQEAILAIHEADYIKRIKKESATLGGDGGDGTTPFGHGSYDIARLAAGGTIAATDAVMRGDVDNAYALVRPPGHHAERGNGIGFCLLANVPIAIEHARREYGVERVLIVDYDVHHGNGAQSIYWDDPNTVTLSIHQQRLFPPQGGELEETGGDEARGSCINVPLPAGCGNQAYLEAIDRVVAPAAAAMKPDLIMVSSGFDPGVLDPLGHMTVTSQGFHAIATRLVEIADSVCSGRVVFSHEGGYSPVQVPFCGLAVLQALSGAQTDVEDPFKIYEGLPSHEIQPWQRSIIDKANSLAEHLSGRWGTPV